ncbi:hypothetical protein HRbin22_00166 [Candidatus Thermoflexus japonica]|uniref:HepT-like domain-containing protein n=1 Tax=Candidatus Thermoflexus japonica TaxID=2035417 RepID=A0A2H5Y3B2_9CHLR|nr:hypothetical protein HRbin22_00166 [Candidatus Thermoflexus japonica]
MRPEVQLLIGRIGGELEDLRRIVERTTRFLEQALRSGEEAYWDAIALNLHGFYVGVERILYEIARVVDQAAPGGPHWHEDLLRQASVEIPFVRPAVLRRSTRDCLDEYRRFRHVVRNVYAFVFDRARLRELAQSLPDCFEEVCRDLRAFQEFLGRMDRETHSSMPGEER